MEDEALEVPIKEIEEKENLDKTHREIRTKLFNQYVVPNLNMVYKLVIQYSMQKEYIKDNYVECLYNYYHYIETYNPEYKIQTWLHIVCKRFIKNLEEHRNNEIQFVHSDNMDVGYDDCADAGELMSSQVDMTEWKDTFDDDIIKALSMLKEIYREAFLLQLSGYSLKEITEISFQNGNLKIKNIDTIKSRLFLARQQLKRYLTEDGKFRGSCKKSG